MNMKIALTFFLLLGVMPYIAAATPGIVTTIDPLSQTTQSDTTVDYLVTIINSDDCCAKTITSITLPVSEGWPFTFSTDLTGQIIPAGEGNSITTTLHITIPPGTAVNTYNHRLNAKAQYEPFPNSGMFGIYGLDTDPEDFNIEVLGGQNAEIPEFPSVAVPVISALGLMLLMTRRKERGS